jgi:hypothetical protein
MAMELKGFAALQALTVLLASHRILLDEGMTHVSTAMGNEASAQEDLPIDVDFVGAIHGKLRSLVGGIGSLVDKEALPEDAKNQWDKFEKIQREYVKEVQKFTAKVDALNQSLSEKKYTYITLGHLKHHHRMIDRRALKEVHAHLGPLKHIWSPLCLAYYEALGGDNKLLDKPTVNKAFKHLYGLRKEASHAYSDLGYTLHECEEIPLRLKTSADGVVPETYIKTSISNKIYALPKFGQEEKKVNLLYVLVLDKMLKDGQLSELKCPVALLNAGTTTAVINNIDTHFFKTLEKTEEAHEFMHAMDQKLFDNIAQYVTRLNSRYGEKLKNENARLYDDFIDLKKRLDSYHQGVAEGHVTLKQSAETPQMIVGGNAHHHGQGLKGDIKNCPFHNAMNKLGLKIPTGDSAQGKD